MSAVPGAPEPTGGGAPPDNPLLDRRLLFVVFFFAVYFFLLYQLARVLAPFAPPLIGAMMIVLIFHPLHLKLGRRVRGPNLGAATSTLLVLCTIVLPVLILLWLLAREAADIAPVVSQWISKDGSLASALQGQQLPAPLAKAWVKVVAFIEKWQIDLRGIALEALREVGNTITKFGAATLKGFFGVILDLIVMVLTLFFFFRDGTRIVRWILDIVPMEERNKQLILGRLDRTLSAIVRGAFITCSAQGLLAGIGLAMTGVPFPVLLGFASALFSLIPFVGASLIWAPAAIYLYFTGHPVAAVVMATWGALVVGLVDNFLRPYVIGEQAQLPILLILVGVLGGIQVFGLIGILISPLLIASVLAFAQIYREEYLAEHPEAKVSPDTLTRR
ncbi:MAG TPA: AI-2E family transporter [Gammaproteobacteria bacterium]